MASVEWVEGPTKTRKGGLHKRQRAVSQKIFKTSDPRCPVAYIEKLLSKRPLELRESGRLYLAPLRKPRDWSKALVWFAKQSLGENSIDHFMKTMAKTTGLDTTNKVYTNHSLRKTLVRKLKKGGAQSHEIMAITGHRNEKSLADYDTLDDDDHRAAWKYA